MTAASFAKRMVQGNFGPPEKTKDDVGKARQAARQGVSDGFELVFIDFHRFSSVFN